VIRAAATASLPNFADYEACRPWREAPAKWLPVALDIVRSHGLACTARKPPTFMNCRICCG
jgi:hypothetical protein